MTRLLFFLAIAFAIVWWIRRPRFSSRIEKQAKAEQDLVRCLHCDVLLPASESIVNAQQQRFCTQTHLEAYRGRQTN